jgi:hypothetical protein
MQNSKEFIDLAGEIFFSKVEPRLKDLLAKRGVRDAHELPREAATQILQQAVVETAAINFPSVDIGSLSHVFGSFTHSEFGPAFTRAISQLEKQNDAFAMTEGRDAAVALAGLGLAVAPFDRKTLRISGEPSNNIAAVLGRFRTMKTAFVGYSVCDSPFYLVYTDCISTLLKRIKTHSQLADVQTLFSRTSNTTPADPGIPFRHGLALFAREPGDRFSTVALNDPSPTSGSIVFLAGWRDSLGAQGAPNDGFMPIPAQFTRAALDNVEIAHWIWRPVGNRTYIN